MFPPIKIVKGTRHHNFTLQIKHLQYPLLPAVFLPGIIRILRDHAIPAIIAHWIIGLSFFRMHQTNDAAFLFVNLGAETNNRQQL